MDRIVLKLHQFGFFTQSC